ncbi:MAG: M15 family metallopeptidase [Fibromonadales bacterium]|nr:M15 family metallopeptidase [Fibromonadales bacterium]
MGKIVITFLIIFSALNVCATEFSGISHYKPEYLERYVKYKEANPELKDFDIVTYVNIGLDFPVYSENIIRQIEEPDNVLALCNKYNYLPEDYVPEGYKKTTRYTFTLRSDAQEQFNKMRAATAKLGMNLSIASGYRSYGEQKRLYDYYKSKEPAKADGYSARPGHSEHQTGLAADINTTLTSARFENAREYKWLIENAHKYGFILRYPKGKEWITGFKFEPWQWRYVGEQAATEIKNLDITLEEYHAIYLIK